MILATLKVNGAEELHFVLISLTGMRIIDQIDDRKGIMRAEDIQLIFRAGSVFIYAFDEGCEQFRTDASETDF